MMTTHSPADATLVSDDEVDAVPPPPGLIEVEVPPGPAELDPLSPPAPLPTEVEDDAEPDEAVDRVFRELLAVELSFRVRQGCRLSMMMVVPPLPPLTIDTLAPPPEVEVAVSATASVAEPASSRAEKTTGMRMAKAFLAVSPAANGEVAGTALITITPAIRIWPMQPKVARRLPASAALAKSAGGAYLVARVLHTQGCGVPGRTAAPVSALRQVGGRSSPAAA
jgi:hypothetical protein